MVTVDVILDLETAFDDDDCASEWFIRGGHYKDAFLLAVERILGDEYGEALIVPREQLRPLVHFGHWTLVTHPDGTQQWYGCSPDDEGAYAVTRIPIGDVRDLAVYRCTPCWDGDHQGCTIRKTPAGWIPLHPIQVGRKPRWHYNPRPF